jgi:hypothetical protein
MPNLLDRYPLSERYQDRAEANLPYGSSSGGDVTNPRVAQTEANHLKADAGVLGNLNLQGQFVLNPLGTMAAGQSAYDTGIGWFFDIDPTAGPRFSIGDSSPGASKLLWDGDELIIVGSVTADDGEIGGWIIGASELTGGNVVLDSSGFIAVGTGDNVAMLSSVDPTYRIWAGDATGADAPFSVTQAGALRSIAGTIGGWTIGANTLVGGSVTLDAANGIIRAGATSYAVGTGWILDRNAGTPRFRVGTTAGDRMQWDGSALTVVGRFEFGSGDYLDDDVLHFEVNGSSVTIIEAASTSFTDHLARLLVTNTSTFVALRIEADDSNDDLNAVVEVSANSSAGEANITFRTTDGVNQSSMEISHIGATARLRFSDYEESLSAGAVQEYMVVTFNGNTRKIAMLAS